TRALRRMREPLPEGEFEPVGGVNPADLVVRAEEVASLRRALACLPGQQRHAFVLREFSGLSYDELADELGLTRPAVESLLFRARQRLRLSLRTALAGLASVPASLRDWVAQLFGSSPETPAAAAKLTTLGVVTKIAAATAGTALVAASVVAVAPHRRHATRPAPAAIAEVATPVQHVVHRPGRVALAPADHVLVHAQPVASTERQSRSGEGGEGGGGPSGHEVSGASKGDGETRSEAVHQDSSSSGPGPLATQAEPLHQDSSSSGPGPSGGDRTTTTSSSVDGSSGGGPDGGGRDGGHGGDAGARDSGDWPSSSSTRSASSNGPTTASRSAFVRITSWATRCTSSAVTASMPASTSSGSTAPPSSTSRRRPNMIRPCGLSSWRTNRPF